mgnify:CR=1 FL=1
MAKKPIHVAVGVIFDNHQADRILIAKRPQHLHQGGLWEFPGGKVSQGETVYQALQRELFEELAIEVVEAQPLMKVAHDYTDKQVLLDIWTVTVFLGEARGVEGQACCWVSLDEILDKQQSEYKFPEANQAILKKLKSLNS